MSARRCLSFLLFAPLLLSGCAAGVGNYGPGGSSLFRTGSRVVHTESERISPTTVRETRWIDPNVHDKWRGALTFGLSIGQDDVTLSGQRDSTIKASRYLHSDVVVNAGNDLWGWGATIGYLSTRFHGSPSDLTYAGITVGPMAFVRILPFLSVDGSYARVFGSVKDDAAYYINSGADAGLDKESLPGWRSEVDANLFLFRSERFDLCLRAGYQSTSTDTKLVFGKDRKYTSQGPLIEIAGLTF